MEAALPPHCGKRHALNPSLLLSQSVCPLPPAPSFPICFLTSDLQEHRRNFMENYSSFGRGEKEKQGKSINHPGRLLLSPVERNSRAAHWPEEENAALHVKPQAAAFISTKQKPFLLAACCCCPTPFFAPVQAWHLPSDHFLPAHEHTQGKRI